MEIIEYTFIAASSLLAHEYGHVAIGKILGWKYHGLVFKRLGIGAAFEIPKDPHGFRLMAAGGIVASLTLASIGLMVGSIMLFAINISIAVVQIIPIPRLSDGWFVLKGWKND